MTRYVGLDLHKHVVQASLINEEGKRLESYRFACTQESLLAFARERLRPEDQIALEATTNTWAVVALLRPFVARIVVANALRTRAIAEAKVKTDKVDAESLAQLLRCDYLPEVWQPDQETQQLRELSVQRSGLVADQTRLKNRVRSLLAQRLISAPMPTLFGVAGRHWLRQAALTPTDRVIIDGFLHLLEGLEAEQERIEKCLAELSYPKEEVRLLMTLPGVGAAAAQALVAARVALRISPSSRACSKLRSRCIPRLRNSPLPDWLLTDKHSVMKSFSLRGGQALSAAPSTVGVPNHRANVELLDLGNFFDRKVALVRGERAHDTILFLLLRLPRCIDDFHRAGHSLA